MPDKRKERLIRHHAAFLDNLDIHEVIEILESKRIVSSTDNKYVLGASAETDKTYRLLNALREKDEKKLKVLSDVLIETKQEHLAALLESDDTSHLMKQKRKNLLNRQRSKLIENLDCSQVVECLRAEVLTTREASILKDVRENQSAVAQNSCLINILLRKGDRAFTSFIEALQMSNQIHLAALLQQTHPDTTDDGSDDGLLVEQIEVDEAYAKKIEVRLVSATPVDVATQHVATRHVKYSNVRQRNLSPPMSQENHEYFFIRSRMNEKVLTAGRKGVKSKEGSMVLMYPPVYPADDNQLFYFDEKKNIRSKLNNCGLDSQDEWLQINTYRNNKHMNWKYEHPKIYLAEDPNMVIDIRGRNCKDGAEVIIFPDNGGLNQQWFLDSSISYPTTVAIWRPPIRQLCNIL